jgi:hypothetical protein
MQILATLKVRSDHSTDRIVYAGSIEKLTEITAPEFSFVVFLDNVRPPFDKVLQEWEQIITLDWDGLGVDTESVKIMDISLQFTLKEENGDKIEVDLLPALNLVEKEHGLEEHELAEAQMDAVFRIMSKDNYLGYNSSLSESQIYFMIDQNPMAHQVRTL